MLFASTPSRPLATLLLKVHVRVLNETLLVPVLMYGSETMLWKGKKRSRIRAVQMDNLRGLLGIRKMDSPQCTDKGVLRSGGGGRRKD